MHATKGRCWLALAMFAFAASPTQAEWITPNSIPNPPPAVGSAAGTLVPAASWVTTQYTGLGLNFSNAAITSLNGVSVWAPLEARGIPAHGIGPPPPPPIGYGMWQGGGVFVLPGTTKPTSVYSMTLEIMGAPVTVDAFNSRWQEFASVGPDGIGPHGGHLYTLSGGGISSFSVFVPVRDPPDTNYPAWGVAAVSFSNNPEPASLVLAGLGLLGLAARFGWRRACGAIA
jgi:PEP-CTERM motif-containing protein